MSNVLYHGPSRWEARGHVSDYNGMGPPGLEAQFVDLGDDRYCMAIVHDSRPQNNAHCAPFYRHQYQAWERRATLERLGWDPWTTVCSVRADRLLDLARRADRGMNP